MKTKKLRILSALLAVAMMFALMPTAAFADDVPATSGDCGKDGSTVKWELDTITGTLTISGTGAMAEYYYYDRPWNSQKDNIKKVVIEDGVTTIGEEAFYACTELAEVDMSKALNLETIGKSAFAECPKLKTVNLPQDGVLKTIGWNAFSYLMWSNADRAACIEKIVIPASVEVIGQYAFDGCANLSEVSFAPGSKLKEIGSEAFSNTNLTEIVIPASVEKIGYNQYNNSEGYVFAGCSQLTKVIFESPSSLKDVAGSTFTNCSENLKIYGDENVKNALTGKANAEKFSSLDALNPVVTFEVDGNVFVKQNAKNNNFKAVKPETPTKKGYQFTGWYTKDDNDKYELFDFDTTITENITLYAQWEKLPDHQLTVIGGTFTVKDETIETEIKDDAVIANVPVDAEVTVTFNKDAYADSNLIFGGWLIEGLDDAENYTNQEEFTFTMPQNGVRIEAMPKAADNDDSSWDAATIVTGAVIGTGTAILAYHIGTELYAEQVLGKDAVVPRTRGEVALLAWQLAGQPEVETVASLTDEAKAQQWAVESGLLKLDAEGNFHAEKKLSKLKALRVLDKAQKTNAN